MGSLTPLLAAPLLVQLHVAFGLAAALAGAARLAWPRSERADRILGWTFLALLAPAAATAVLLSRPPGTPNLFGLTLGHAFVVATVIGIAAAIRTARHPNGLLWRRIVTALFAGVLLTCGLFELAPGRLMHTVLAGG
ncbi:MAG TPA: hypothetical protein VF699_10225 [Caulobacteraceae bacterium]|jgi:uncharacterized membrane protein